MFILNANLPGGAEILTFQLANTLASDGERCTIVSLITAPGETLRSDTVPVLSCNGNHLYSVGTMKSLASTIRTHSPDIVVAVNQRPLLFAVISKRLARSRAKLVSVFHTSYLLKSKDRLLNLLYRPLFARADALIYVSEQQRRLWEQRGYRSQRAIVIHNGIDPHRFSTSSVTQWRHRMREEKGFAPEDYVVGMTARFFPEKNHRQLIDAIKLLRARKVPAKALLVGTGPTLFQIEEYARALGILEHIVFAGRHEDVRPYVSACDVGTLCSLGESFPLAPLEMMAIGIPVVMSNVGGAAEMICQGENGFLFPVGDTEAMVGYLEALFEPGRRKAFGDAACKLVAERFAMERMVDGYKRLFYRLLSDPRHDDLIEARKVAVWR